MRRLFFALLLAIGCTGEKVETMASDQVTDVPEPAPPIVETHEVVKPTEVVAPHEVTPEPIDEELHCPSRPFDHHLLGSIYIALVDPANKEKFDDWKISRDSYGTTVEATFVHWGGMFYKVYWTFSPTHPTMTFMTFWQRTDRPFTLESDEMDYVGADTFSDHGIEGCVNFGHSDLDDPGKMQWNTGDPLNVKEFHGVWQARHTQGLEALAITLGLIRN